MSSARNFIHKVERDVTKAGSDVLNFTKKVTKDVKEGVAPAMEKLHPQRWASTRSSAPGSSWRRASPATSRMSLESSAPPASVVPPHGYLSIWHGRFGRWRPRSFSVSPEAGTLVYHSSASATGGVAAWSISLHEAAVKREGRSGRRFQVVTQGGSYHFKAANREAAALWMDAIREAISSNLEHRLQTFSVAKAKDAARQEAGSVGEAQEGRRQPLSKLVDARVEAHMRELTPFINDIEELLCAARDDATRALDRMSLRPTLVPAQAVAVEGTAAAAAAAGGGGDSSSPRPLPPQPGVAEGRSAFDSSPPCPLPAQRRVSVSVSPSEMASARSTSELWHDAPDASVSSWLNEEPQEGLQASWAQLLVKVQAIVRKDACRLLEVEEENAALRGLLKTRPASTQGPTAASAAAAAAAAAADSSGGEGGELFISMAADGQVEEGEVGTGVEEEEELPSGPDSDEEGSVRAKATSLGQAVAKPPAPGRRPKLPVDQPKAYGFSIWSVLRQAIGRDLTRITMPATINEPLSSIQRVAEEHEYRDLLHNALGCDKSIDRLMWVAVYVLSAYGATLPRVNKPFNPLLGETYEWEAPEGDFSFVCEQVSHHPPISCWHGEGRAPAAATAAGAGAGAGAGAPPGSSYVLFGEVETRSKFWGKTVDIVPTGTSFLRLKLGGGSVSVESNGGEELYSWGKATCTIHNIIFGKPYIDWSGEVVVQNRTTGEFARLVLPKCNGRLGERGVVEGAVCDRNGNPQYTISGSYSDQLVAKMTASLARERGVTHAKPQVVFCVAERPPWASEQYNMTTMAMQLNELLPEHGKGRLPPTDSRYRTDQRFLEDGKWDDATNEKLRLEEKQRGARKVRAAAGEEYKPLWFDLQRKNGDGSMVQDPDDEASSPCWTWNAAYRSRDWARCPDIYSPHMPSV